MVMIPNYQITELLMEDFQRFIYRAIQKLDGRHVLVKHWKQDASLGGGQTDAICEQQNLELLNNGNGFIRPLDLKRVEGKWYLIAEDPGGIPLRTYLQSRPIELEDFFALAMALAELLERLHHAGVAYVELRPELLLIEPRTYALQLIDYRHMVKPRRLDASLPKEVILCGKQDLLDDKQLPYLSPEQFLSDRKAVDYRSTFYALGVILYEVVTSELPFEASGWAAWRHAHLARTPMDPCVWNPYFPPAIWEILSKLLAKEPDERYQSLIGLKADLLACHEQILREEKGLFLVGMSDQSIKLRIRDRLYGRKTEALMIKDAAEQAQTGTTQFMLVSGPPGIGKTALIRDMLPQLAKDGASTVSATFEPQTANEAATPLYEAFRGLVRRKLAAGEQELRLWRTGLKSALGMSLPALYEALPELKRVVGNATPYEPLPALEARGRFQSAFCRFVRFCASEDEPLILFVDDLHKADEAALNMLGSLLQETQHLFLIAAVQEEDNSTEMHCWRRWLSRIENKGIATIRLPLAPLKQEYLLRMTADSLGCEAERVLPLVKWLQRRTEGNPLFFNQLLLAIYEEEHLWYDGRVWMWDLEAIRNMNTPDELSLFLTRRLQRLSPETRELLGHAACIGETFSLQQLARMRKEKPHQSFAVLLEALSAGLVQSEDESYMTGDNTNRSSRLKRKNQSEDRGMIYRFAHGSIYRSAYYSLPAEEREKIHLIIARLLLTAPQTNESVITAVYHLQMVSHLLSDMDERLRFAELCFLAGENAIQVTDFDSARRYFALGASLLGDDHWKQRSDFCYRLLLRQAECEYACGEFTLAETLAEQLIQRAQTALQRASVAQLQIYDRAFRGEVEEALQIGQRCLEELGISFSLVLDVGQLAQTFAQAEEKVRPWLAERWNMQAMSDERIRLAMDILLALMVPAMVTDPRTYAAVVCKMIELTFDYGYSPVAPAAYAVFAMMLGLHRGDTNTGRALGKLAVEKVEQDGGISSMVKTIVHTQYGMVFADWQEPPDDSDVHLRLAVRFGLATGNPLYIWYAMGCRLHRCFAFGRPDELATLVEECRNILRFETIPKHLRNHHIDRHLTLYSDYAAALLESDTDRSTFRKENYFLHTEGTDEPEVQFLSSICRMKLSYLFGRHADALDAAEEAERLSAYNLYGNFAEHRFYMAVAAAALWESWSKRQQKMWQDRLASIIRELEQTSRINSVRYLSKYWLASAEWARIAHDRELVMDNYDRAIRAGRTFRQYLLEAVACERAADYALSIGNEALAEKYISEAYREYARSGAVAKAEQFLDTYGRWIGEDATGLGLSVRHMDGGQWKQEVFGQESRSANMSVDQDERLPERETDLRQWFERHLQTILEVAGASHGYLVLRRGKYWLVEAKLDYGKISVFSNGETAERRPLLDDQETRLPLSVMHYVLRTGETVILNDAAADGIFTGDKYVKRTGSRSVLCLPIAGRKMPKGALILENPLIRSVFAPEQTDELNKLLSRALLVHNSRGSSRISSTLLTAAPDGSFIPPLTERELELLSMMAEGLSNEEIASRMVVTEGTVKQHTHSIFKKLQVKQRMKAVLRAQELKLL